jgi:putative transcriptional regulator
MIRSPLSIRKDNYDRYYPPASTELPLIRFHLAAVLERRGWTPYRLARVTGLTVPTAYRLADPKVRFGRFTADTLDRLCAALDVQPGELLEWVPETTRRRARR